MRPFQNRNTRYGSVALGSVAVFLAILFAINWIASRQNKRFDLTKSGEFQLSEQTQKLLRELKQPVNVRVFYTQETGSTSFKDKLEDYAYYSKQFTYEVIDANKEPVKAREDKIDSVPTGHHHLQRRVERATSVDEQALTNALKKAIEGKAKKVYFVSGHNEHDTTDSTTSRGYGKTVEKLKTDNFDVAKLVLAQEGKVPDDATLLVVAGPKSDYPSRRKSRAIRVFLKKGASCC